VFERAGIRIGVIGLVEKCVVQIHHFFLLKLNSNIGNGLAQYHRGHLASNIVIWKLSEKTFPDVFVIPKGNTNVISLLH
jgi:hypothetical protein